VREPESAIFASTHLHTMKDITLLFSIGLALVLGITSLDRTIEKISSSAANQSTLGLPGFYSSLETASAYARSQGQPIVLVFGQTGEPSSQRLKSDVLVSSNVNAIKEQFVWAWIDVDQDRHRLLRSRYNVTKAPVTCVVDALGRELGRIQGSLPSHHYVKQIQACLDHPSRTTPPLTPPSK
jgi:hypothetical protein